MLNFLIFFISIFNILLIQNLFETNRIGLNPESNVQEDFITVLRIILLSTLLSILLIKIILFNYVYTFIPLFIIFNHFFLILNIINVLQLLFSLFLLILYTKPSLSTNRKFLFVIVSNIFYTLNYPIRKLCHWIKYMVDM